MIRLWWIIQKYSVHVGVESGCYLDLLKLTTAAEKSIDTNLQKKHHAHPQTLKLALVNPVFIELNAVVEKELQIKQIKVVSEKLIQIWDIKCKDKRGCTFSPLMINVSKGESNLLSLWPLV